MNKLLPIIYVFSCLIAAYSFAGSATWNADPVDNNWNNPANWIPATVPNGPGDVATFSVSSVTNISFSDSVELGQLVFASDASAYQMTLYPYSFTLSGSGITNTSTNAQHINFTGGSFMSFLGSSSAGSNSGTIISASSGSKIAFYDQSSAGTASFSVSDSPSTLTFTDSSTAGQATISDNNHALVTFIATSNAGSAEISTSFGDISVDSTAYAGPNASFICNYGSIYVYGKNDVQVAIYGGGGAVLQVGSKIYRAPGVGSIAGDGIVHLIRGSTLTVGGNNLNVEYDGAIINDEDTGRCGGLIKVGTGTLTFATGNEYCLGTTVNSGVLLVKNTSGSGTGSGPVTIAGGTLGGRGIISAKVTVGTGVIAPSQGASNPTTMTLQNQLIIQPNGSYLFRLNTNKGTADQVIAKGVTLKSGAQFNFMTVGNEKLTAGTVFTAISNRATTPIFGTFANLADGSTVTVGVNKLQVSYSGGDGNDLTLTVVQ